MRTHNKVNAIIPADIKLTDLNVSIATVTFYEGEGIDLNVVDEKFNSKVLEYPEVGAQPQALIAFFLGIHIKESMEYPTVEQFIAATVLDTPTLPIRKAP